MVDDGPIFPPAAVADQTSVERLPFMTTMAAHAAATAGGRPVRILEIGSWAGASLMIWAEAAARLAPAGGEIVCVDPWAPYFAAVEMSATGASHYDKMDAAAASGDILAIFRHNAGVARRAFGIKVVERRGTSREVLPTLADGAFDLVYIDGSHLYPDVAYDIAQAKRLVRDGGIVCGDDLEMTAAALPDPGCAARHIDRDVADLDDGRWYHPGVTLAVAEAFSDTLAAFGFWAVVKTDGGFSPPQGDGLTVFRPRFWPPERIARLEAFLAGT